MGVARKHQLNAMPMNEVQQPAAGRFIKAIVETQCLLVWIDEVDRHVQKEEQSQIGVRGKVSLSPPLLFPSLGKWSIHDLGIEHYAVNIAVVKAMPGRTNGSVPILQCLWTDPISWTGRVGFVADVHVSGRLVELQTVVAELC